MLKSILKFIVLLFLPFSLSAEEIPSLKFTVSFSKTEVKVGDEVEIIFKAAVPAKYHAYGTSKKCVIEDDGPQMAEIADWVLKGVQKAGALRAIGEKIEHDDVFDCDAGVFHGKAEFRQKVKILSGDFSLNGTLNYQVCSENSCAFHKLDFNLSNKNIKIAGGVATQIVEPIDTPIELIDTPMVALDTAKVSSATQIVPSYKKGGPGDNVPTKTKTFGGVTSASESLSFWDFFLLALLSGLTALLTPCVFPMIPMTVSFFMKDSKSRVKAIRNGILFGLSLIFIYVVLGTLTAIVFGADAGNWLSTHWLPNLLFFIIFVIFAASFLGAFEIVLPSWLVNKVDQKADKGGMAGIFFMAFTIALVSFSCTGPIVGTVLVQSINGTYLKPILGMFGFSLAFALPFALFAVFPSWLQSLPKSGGWLNSVKVCLGFLELALGLKFLSTADQTYHWHLMDREVYLAFWIIIFGLLGLYLLGKLRFSHDSELKFIGVPRLFLSIITLSFVVYMIPGMWGAPLKGLAGYLPPLQTQDFDMSKIVREAQGIPDKLCDKPLYGDKLHVPLGIQGYFDYDQAVACAKKQNKPLFLDFTGHACVTCRKMEESVWSDPKVFKLLNEEFVVASLYVDDKKAKLQAADFYTSRRTGKEIKMLSDKNTDIQIAYFGKTSQPQYVILDGNEDMMAPDYTIEDASKDISADKFGEFLLNSLAEFRKKHPKTVTPETK